jgi:hypothetical protein
MKNPYGLILDSPKGAEKKEEDPKKMGQDNDVCGHFIGHFIKFFSQGMFYSLSQDGILSKNRFENRRHDYDTISRGSG